MVAAPSFPPDAGSIRDYAAAYVEAGWSLIPVRPGEKRPLMKWEDHQTKRATMTDVDTWLKQWPAMNLGLVTGSISNVAALDIDGDAGVESLRESGHTPPASLIQKTPHGWHVIYRLGGRSVKTAAGILPHVDTRGDGGYIVVTPSRLRPDEVYRWHHRLPIAPVPDWLERPEVLQAPPAPSAGSASAGAPDWVRRAIEKGVDRGRRNAVATRLAGYFHSLRVPDDIIRTILAPFASRCEPPMDAPELAGIVRSVSRYAVQAREVGVSDPPVRIDTGDGYRYEWDGIGVRATFGALHKERDGIFAELVVESGIPGTSQRVYGPMRFNMMAVTTRTSLCNALTKRVEGVDWDRLMDDASRLTVESYRQGEPLQLLRDAVEPPGDGWLLAPLVMEDGPTLWFAKGGAGKSWLALVAAASISTGREYGLGIAPSSRKRVCFLDWEWEAWRHRRRLRTLMGDVDLRTCDVLHRRCNAPLVEMASDLRRLLVAEQVGFVVVDSAVPACGGEPEMSAPVRDFFLALRSLGVGSLIIAHNNKSGDEEHPYGNIFWFNESRCIWHVGKTQEAGDDVLHVGMFSKKTNDGGLALPRGYCIQFAPAGVHLQPEDVRDVQGLRTKLTLFDQALASVRRRSLTYEEIATETGIPEASVRSYMHRALERQLVRRVENPGELRVRWEAV